MDIDNKTMVQAYNPFLRLAIYNFGCYTCWIVVICIYFFVIMKMIEEDTYPWLSALVIYLILCIKAFWIVVFSILERKIRCFDRKLLKVIAIDTDGLFGDYKNGNQEVKRCYSKELAAERNKIICVDNEGKKHKLRLIGSKKKMKRIKDWFLLRGERVYLTYGKLTKIILFIESTEPRNSMEYTNVKLLNRMF